MHLVVMDMCSNTFSSSGRSSLNYIFVAFKNYSSRVHKTNLLSNNRKVRKKKKRVKDLLEILLRIILAFSTALSLQKCGVTYFNTNITFVSIFAEQEKKEMWNAFLCSSSICQWGKRVYKSFEWALLKLWHLSWK